jgi:hypothetical protein
MAARIDDPTADADLFGSGKDGFTEGDPGLVAPTQVRAAWLNGIQEEVVGVIEDAGLTPDAGDLGQLLTALNTRTAYMHCDVSGNAITAGNKLTLSNVAESGGFVVASNEITMPSNGWYLICVMVHAKFANTSDPQTCDLLLNGSVVLKFQTLRGSASANDYVQLIAFSLVGSTFSGAFSLQNGATGGAVSVLSGAVGTSTIDIIRLVKL